MILSLIKKAVLKKLLEVYVRLKKEHEYGNMHQIREQLAFHGEPVYLPMLLSVKNPQYISIGSGFAAMNNLRIEAWDAYAGVTFSPSITIGENVCINTDCHIGCIDNVQIGNNVLIGSRVMIIDHEHGDTGKVKKSEPPGMRQLTSKGPVVIEDDVWICEGACILGGVRVGKGAIIAANAVVNKDVPSYTIVGGVPAKVLKKIEAVE